MGVILTKLFLLLPNEYKMLRSKPTYIYMCNRVTKKSASKDCCSKIFTRLASLYLRFGLANLNALCIWYTPIGCVLSLKKWDYLLISTLSNPPRRQLFQKWVWLEICKLIFLKILTGFWILYGWQNSSIKLFWYVLATWDNYQHTKIQLCSSSKVQ
jgi:hypothetical protein